MQTELADEKAWHIFGAGSIGLLKELAPSSVRNGDDGSSLRHCGGQLDALLKKMYRA